jgi:hypothetical protein
MVLIVTPSLFPRAKLARQLAVRSTLNILALDQMAFLLWETWRLTDAEPPSIVHLIKKLMHGVRILKSFPL